MAGNDKQRPPDQTVENAQTPTHGAITGGPPTPGRAGNGMGVSTGDYTDAPPPGTDQPSGNVSNVPPTPNADKAERPRRREEGLE